jgi:hypothetical protein
MRWEKRGLLMPAPPPVPWAATHAALPVVGQAKNERADLFFSSRDAEGRSHIGAAELDLDRWQISVCQEKPALRPGPLGSFDDSGTTSSCLVEHDGRRYLYYSGWARGVTVPFSIFVGCAVSADGGTTWEKVSAAPLLERTDVDPYLTASPWVLIEDGLWRMWYVSGTGWRVVDGAPRPWYHIKYAESRDGLRWARDGLVCIDSATPDEYAFGRPCVVKDGDRYRMWYCSRGTAYRIGYAESDDGLRWHRKDGEAGIDLSLDGWDSEMQAYPLVLDYGGARFMLYNGNGYGETGIGYAVQVA